MQTIIATEKSFLNAFDLSEEWCQKLVEATPEIQSKLVYHPPVVVYGKLCFQQRSVRLFSDVVRAYRYSGQEAASLPFPDVLKDLLHDINEMFHAEFNSILVNMYENGEEYISAHSDDEAGLDQNMGVVSISVGAVRNFRIRDKSTKKIVADVPTLPNKILQMCGDFQREFTHEVPVEKRVRDMRFSFTFRKLPLI